MLKFPDFVRRIITSTENVSIGWYEYTTDLPGGLLVQCEINIGAKYIGSIYIHDNHISMYGPESTPRTSSRVLASDPEFSTKLINFIRD